MGNDNYKQQADQAFYRTCHSAFAPYQLDQSMQLLCTFVRKEQAILDWRKGIDPLLSAKFLLMPFKIVSDWFPAEYGCLMQDDSYRMDIQNYVVRHT